MGYMHIENLYKFTKILNFKRCYALEKVHGTSAHVAFKRRPGCDGGLDHVCGAGCAPGVTVTYFSGGEKHENFVKLFDEAALIAAYERVFRVAEEVVVYGEAYGGRCQKMADTYGATLRFIAFDVLVGDKWLSVPSMAQTAEGLGLEVVPWEETSTELDALNALRDRPSEVGVRRGCGEKPREGIVLRPLEEMTINNDQRMIAKHKIDRFGERNTPQTVHNVDSHRLEVLAQATEIANEWVTEERLSHVLDHLTVDGVGPDIKQTGKVIAAMVEDVYREAKGEIVESKEAQGAITRKTAAMFKARLQAVLS